MENIFARSQPSKNVRITRTLNLEPHQSDPSMGTFEAGFNFPSTDCQGYAGSASLRKSRTEDTCPVSMPCGGVATDKCECKVPNSTQTFPEWNPWPSLINRMIGSFLKSSCLVCFVLRCQDVVHLNVQLKPWWIPFGVDRSKFHQQAHL